MSRFRLSRLFHLSAGLRAALRLGFALALAVVMWLAVQPAPDLVQLFSWQDKVEHALLFAALAAFGATAWPRQPVALVGGLLLYGAAMELAQSFTAFRVGDPWDWLADAVGTLAMLPLLRAGLRATATRTAGAGA